MKHCLIVTRHVATAAALKSIYCLSPFSDASDSGGEWNEPTISIAEDSNDTIRNYEWLCTRIRAWVADLNPKPATGVALVDGVHINKMNPIRGDCWSSAVAMAILTFPELHWLFGAFFGKADPHIVREHSLSGLFNVSRDPLMDYTGLRTFIRNEVLRTEDEEGRRIAPYIPVREALAVALDDEIPYAYLGAYAAYRNGLRALPVTRDAVARHIFGPSVTTPPGVTIVFEDVYLNFPDQRPRVHYSDLGGGGERSRRHQLPGLSQADFRIFVTSDHRHVGDADKHERNRAYVGSSECARQYSVMVRKPLSGLFDLWDRSGLQRRLRWTDDFGRTRRGCGTGFLWPPAEPEASSDDFGHSAPGRLVLIAEELISRAHEVQLASCTMPQVIHAAVLATDALELTGGRTPTTAAEALVLKHRLEVEAECRFSGVEYHIRMLPRIADIRREVAALSRWFNPQHRVIAAQNAEMMVLSGVVAVLKDHNQFDEEQLCMNRIRHLHNSLWMRQRPLRYLLYPAVRYVEFLLSSFMRFAFVIAAWVFVLAWMYSSFHAGAFHEKWHIAFEEAVTSFFSVGSPVSHAILQAPGAGYVSVVCLAIILGFVHLGVFVSHLYSSLSRR